jgi:hypothetical protein
VCVGWLRSSTIMDIPVCMQGTQFASCLVMETRCIDEMRATRQLTMTGTRQWMDAHHLARPLCHCHDGQHQFDRLPAVADPSAPPEFKDQQG